MFGLPDKRSSIFKNSTLNVKIREKNKYLLLHFTDDDKLFTKSLVHVDQS
jgi:hypothetical protein